MTKVSQVMQNDKKAGPVDVLLITPPDDFSRYPYLGTAQLAAVLQQRGIRVAILDSAAMKFGLKEIVQYALSVHPRIIGISVMSMMLRFCYELVNELKRVYPRGMIVIGGSHLDADCTMMERMGAPYGFWGEVEDSFADFCEMVMSGRQPGDLPGLIVKNNTGLSISPPVLIDDLNRLPMPAYDLLPIGKYYSPSSGGRTMSYISSRGCPYRCSYCSKLQQKIYRSIDAGRVADDVKRLYQDFGIQWVEFVDEIFTLKRDRIFDFCDQLKWKKLPIRWGMGTRIDLIDEEMIIAMKQAGLSKIGFGIESGVERIRYALNKKIANETIFKTLALCKKHHIITMASFILGLPGETERDIRETILFAKRLPLNYVYFNRLIPIPNSEIFDTMVKSGQIEKDIWSQFMLGEREHPVFCPEGIAEGVVRKLYRDAWMMNYIDVKRIWRNRRLIAAPDHLSKSFKGFIRLASWKRYNK